MPIKLHKIFLFLCLINGLFSGGVIREACAQSPYHNYRFESYTVSQGLSESFISAIAEDKYGEICVGSQKGLGIFNGYDFEDVGGTGKRGELLFIQHVSSMPNGFMLVRTMDEESLFFNPADRTFTAADTLLHQAGFNQLHDLYCLLAIGSHQLWYGTNGGILIEDTTHYSFPGLPRFKYVPLPDSPDIISLHEDTDHRIWALTSKNQILILDPVTMQCLEKIDDRGITGSKKPLNSFSVYGDRNRHIWINSSAGVYFFDAKASGRQPAFKKIALSFAGRRFDNMQVNCLYMDDHGLLWIGTQFEGVFIYDPGNGEVVAHLLHLPFYAKSLNSNTIFCINEDSHNRIWIGTSNGINKYDPNSQKFALYDQQKSAPWRKLSLVFGITGVDDRHIAAVSDGKFFIINTVTGEMEQIKEAAGDEAHGDILCRDGSGVIWSATHSGLRMITKKGGRYLSTKPHDPELRPLENMKLSALLAEGDSLLWIGAYQHGLYLWNRVNHRLIHYPVDGLVGPMECNVKSLIKSSDSICWIGTTDGIIRVNRLTGEQKHFLSIGNGPVKQRAYVLDMAFDEGYLWLATMNRGLIRFDISSGAYRSFSIAEGLPDNTVWACRPDLNHHIWLSTNKGISEYMPDKNLFVNYTEADGLQSAEFNAGSAYRNKKGEIFFGGIYGINKIDPGHIARDTLPVPVMVTNLEIHAPGEVTNIFPGDHRSFTFSDKENTLILQFEALNFISPEFNNFRYKLIHTTNPGKDEENGPGGFWAFLTFSRFIGNTWIEAGNRNSVIFSHLAPGKYLFMLDAENRNGTWNEEPYTLELTIRPPFWQTVWFKILVALVLVALLYAIFRWRLRAIRRKNRERAEKASLNQKIKQLERMALQAQMNPHFIFNSLNSIKAYILSSEPDEAVDYLNDFAFLMRKVLQNSKKETITLSEELEAIESYIKLEERRLKKNIGLLIHKEDGDGLFRVFIPPLIIQPFVENAIWHGIRPLEGAGKIEIFIRREMEGILQIIITDNGVGRENARVYRSGRFKKQSMGVSITQERLSHFNKRKIENIKYEDLPEHGGTKVSLWLQVDTI